VPFAAIVAPTRAMVVGSDVVNVPPQVLVELLATINPAGRLSVNATPANATLLTGGFVMVKVNEEIALNAIVVGLNAFTIDGGHTWDVVNVQIKLAASALPNVSITPVVTVAVNKVLAARPPVGVNVSVLVAEV